jgi:DNA-binding response OmpR family regulator
MPKMVLVDDDLELLELLRIRLEIWGYEVAVASEGKEAQELADAIEPARVICDDFVVEPRCDTIAACV